MALNRSAQEQSDRADRIHAEVYGKTATVAAPVTSVVDPQVVAPVVETPLESPAVLPVAENWEQKYRVLQGKYSAEVPRLAEQLRDQTERIRSLEQKATVPVAPVVDIGSMTPEAVVEQFGEDFAKAVGSVAERIAAASSQKLRDEFAPQVEAVAQTTAKTLRQEFMRDLTALVPDWREIDTNEAFTAFLDAVDPLSGRPRRDFFNHADQTNNAERMAKFFTSFTGKSPVTPASAASRMSIENHLAPSTVQITNSPQAKKFWTRGDINKFYSDQRRGLYSADEARRVESDIFAAQGEGRLAA